MQNTDQFDAESLKKAGIQYILQPINCGDDSETFTVRQYLEMFGIPIEDPFFFEWQSLVLTVSTFVRKAEKKIPEQLMEMIWMAVFVCAYVYYDTEKPFLPQFMKSKDELLQLIDGVRKDLQIK